MKKVFKFLSVGLIAGIMTGTFAGCGSAGGNTNKIGMVVSTLDNPFFVNLKAGAEDKAKELGYELIVVDSQNDSSKELSNVEDLLQKGVSALIINPVDSDAAKSSVIKANSEEVPVITVDRQANGGEVKTHIASDNIKGGEMAAEYIKEKLGGAGIIAELQGTPGASATRDRGTGFHNIVDADNNLNVISSQPADFDRQKGLTVTENMIQSNHNIQAIFAHNDEMALGAVKALNSGGLKDCIVVGFDGGEDAINAVDSGELSATIAQQPDLMGGMAVESAKKINEGESVEKEISAELKLYTGK
ncbi:ribose ABC transporter substrate-binding protein RbsB [Clostridium butyricum]|uniref:ribose ABC transporter substrate-binding protein RbsB n=1 Tax=Clostridium butyricum TaxID=1492 RepID=UPI00071E9E3A|nr:ribose ABC transporter substrate-binding protein RbsB [Clostridium butyricum]ALR90412.1 D-ribose ABC transporter substrate-binding protein [Clostridium butyricum]ALS18654.1 D-ribose ABC transporter substrate-binding protein [Clostridium butyricum]ANF15834.1 D-ribose ABC transporter substrate-binding protein [Clostridium butyricum]AOR95753.1 D-ribose ABC transporter substrate-binding protein [Clostridium butyricum]MDM8133121.1 ribose ABC transporter substrate-binding protein RbsB [Clostridiu